MTMQEEDKFRKLFKYFKSKEKSVDLSKVVYFTKHNPDIKIHKTFILNQEMDARRALLGLKPPAHWNIFTHHKHPGLIVIQNPFTELGTLTWIRRCLSEFSNFPHKTNLSQLGLISEDKSWFMQVFQYLSRGEKNKLINQLRWATLGYHHNWDTKEYSDKAVSKMPDKLQELCRIILSGAGLAEYENYIAEAAIVNYYPVGSTLSPHTDHSEPYKDAPLLSFSFGRSAIFLIGGSKKSVEPTPLYLNHGDVMIMTKSARLSYHAVPRILDDKDNENLICGSINKFKSAVCTLIELLNTYNTANNCLPEHTFIDVCKIAVNWETEAYNDSYIKYITRIPPNNSCVINSCNEESEPVYNSFLIKAIYNYVTSCRININIRQVNEASK